MSYRPQQHQQLRPSSRASSSSYVSHANTVPIRTVKEEARFYNDAEQTYNKIEDFKRRVERQNQEFNTLLQYYQQNEGRLDFSNLMDGQGGLLPHRPNLGTDSQSWYYLDERGNKIWVQNVKLDTSDAKTGAFVTNQHADGKVIVVKVPTHKRNYCLQPDYKKKCMEYESYRRLQQIQNPSLALAPPSGRPSSSRSLSASRPGTAGSTSMRANSAHAPPMASSPIRFPPMIPPFSGHQNGSTTWVPAVGGHYPSGAFGGVERGSSPIMHGGGGGAKRVGDMDLATDGTYAEGLEDQENIARYVQGQQALASQLVRDQQVAYRHGHEDNSSSTSAYRFIRPANSVVDALPATVSAGLVYAPGGQAVYRPPTSIEEADARLEELRREEAWLRQQVAM